MLSVGLLFHNLYGITQYILNSHCTMSYDPQMLSSLYVQVKPMLTLLSHHLISWLIVFSACFKYVKIQTECIEHTFAFQMQSILLYKRVHGSLPSILVVTLRGLLMETRVLIMLRNHVHTRIVNQTLLGLLTWNIYT